jgi:hypothetical protein
MLKRTKVIITVAAIVLSAILYLVSRSGTNESKEIVQNPNNKTVVYSASFLMNGGHLSIYEREVPVEIVNDERGDPQCIITDSDWEELKAVNEDIESRFELLKDQIDSLFSAELLTVDHYNGHLYSADREWSQRYDAWVEVEDPWCYGQDIIYHFESAIEVPWNNKVEEYSTDQGYVTDELPAVEMTESNGYFYFDVSNISTHAHLGFSFDGERLYDLVEGIMLEDAVKLKNAKVPLLAIEKSYPIESLNTKEIASFVVNQEDHRSRDIFVRLIEAILPISATEPSLSFIQSSSQKGNQSHGSVSGTQDGNIGGLIMGGWGFVSGSLEGSFDGSIDSKPVMLIRGSVYLVPKP